MTTKYVGLALLLTAFTAHAMNQPVETSHDRRAMVYETDMMETIPLYVSDGFAAVVDVHPMQVDDIFGSHFTSAHQGSEIDSSQPWRATLMKHDEGVYIDSSPDPKVRKKHGNFFMVMISRNGARYLQAFEVHYKKNRRDAVQVVRIKERQQYAPAPTLKNNMLPQPSTREASFDKPKQSKQLYAWRTRCGFRRVTDYDNNWMITADKSMGALGVFSDESNTYVQVHDNKLPTPDLFIVDANGVKRRVQTFDQLCGIYVIPEPAQQIHINIPNGPCAVARRGH